MSIYSTGGFKAPAGITSRNDGGGPGSGNFYGGPPMPYEEEDEKEDDRSQEEDTSGNPFKKLTFVSPALNMRPSFMMPVKTLAANTHYQKYLQDVIPDVNKEYADAQNATHEETTTQAQ